jgi:tetratricopeptide (TPR) repeat protein
MNYRPGSNRTTANIHGILMRRLLLTCALLGTLASASRAENRPAWIEVRSPNFIVVTNANERQGRRTAYQFEMIRAVFRDFFGQTNNSQEPPITIVAAKDEKTLKALLPEFWERKGAVHPAGVYLNTGDTGANYIGLRLDVSLNQDAYEPFEPVYHEYVHYLTRRMIAHLPLWLVEGIAEFYGNTRMENENKNVFVGAPSTSHILLLRQKSLLPLDTLFDVNSSSPYYHEESKASIFYAESWALTHYLKVRDSNDKSHHLRDFLDLLAKGIDQKDAAKQTIGDPQSLEPELRAYIKNSEFRVGSVAPPKVDENAFQVRGLTDAESMSVRADFMAHDNHYSEAQTMLEQALKLDPNLSAGCETMSFISLQQGKQDEAAKWAEQAIALNPQSYWGNYYYATSLLRAHQNDDESIAKAQASLRTVVKINPAFAPAYDMLAYALGLPGSHQDLKEAYSMTLWAVQCEPGNVQYRLRGVQLHEQMGDADNAVRSATFATKMAKTPEEQKAAAEALESAQKFQEYKQKVKEFEAAQNSGTAKTSPVAVPGVQKPPAFIGSAAGVQVAASAEVLLLSDPQGVDFGPYLNKEVLPTLQKAWTKLAPSVAKSTAGKSKGKTVIEFAIQKDGSVSELKVKESFSDATLDTALLDSLKSVTPFHALPAQFKGKSLTLQFDLSFHPVTEGE